MSEELELDIKPSVEAGPDILPEEVEANLNRPVVLEEDELDDYSGDHTDLEGNLSRG